MRGALSVFLMAIGAALYWAVTGDVEGVDLDVVGVILMVAGGLGLIWSLLASSAIRRHRPSTDDEHVVRHVYEER